MTLVQCPNCSSPAVLQLSDGSFACKACSWTMSPVSGSSDVSSATPESGKRGPPGLPNEWDVVGVLGEGGMGTVWRARNRLTEEAVAIKCMQDAMAQNSEGLQRFLREVKVLRRLSHPGIVRLVHAGLLATGGPYLVLELIDGLTLRQVMDARPDGQLEATEAIRVALAIAEAMEYTHAQGVIHRDLKPENVLIDSRGAVKVADFGLAGLDAEWDENARVMRTRAGASMGTPGYMAPEQLGRAGEVGPAADVYALGVTIFESLAGRLPYGPEGPGKVAGGITELADDLVCRMLAREPEERPAAAEIRKTLEAVKAKLRDPSWTNSKDGSVLLRIQGGTFGMGSATGRKDEEPVHPVTLSPYSVGKRPVTWGQYRAFCRETRRADPPDPGFPFDDSHPVVNVSWDDAAAYCSWAGLRLPSEAEWELAARGEDGRSFPWGNGPPDETLANFDSRHGGTRPAGSYPRGASPHGCLDMAGNVWEWTADWFGPYGSAAETDPRGPKTGSQRALRGGGWCYDAAYLRATAREALDPGLRLFEFGFRVAGPNA